MTDIQALIIGIVQGLTEFLPVSSSGHIAIVQALFHISEPGITFAVAVHIATLVAVLVAFWRDVWNVVAGVFGGLAALLTGRVKASKLWRQNSGFRVGLLIVVASIPAAIVGFLLADFVASLFASLLAVGAMLLITGVLLWLSDGVTAKGSPMREFDTIPAFIVGVFQAAAVAPGLSRSGATIAAGRFMGLSRDAAARFSFLLSIPAILGAALVDVKNLLAAGTALTRQLYIGMGAAAIVGYVAILLVMRLVRAGRLRVFSFYCWAAGLSVIIWQLLGR